MEGDFLRPWLLPMMEVAHDAGELDADAVETTTSNSAASGPGPVSTRAVTSAYLPSSSTTTSPGSRFGGVLKESEIVSRRAVEEVGGHFHERNQKGPEDSSDC
jgi:hypothetical protein